MDWSVQWTDQGLRDLSALDPPVAKRVVAKLEQAVENPEHYFRRLAGSGDFKLRIGDYRLLAMIDHGTKTIFVERVDHRSRIYER